MKIRSLYQVLISLLIVVLINITCQRRTYEIYNLTGELFQADLPYMRFPSNIGLMDSVVVILDLAAEGYFYHLSSYPDFVYQYSIGHRGNGPGEIVLPTRFQTYKESIILLDGAQGNLFWHTPYSDQTLIAQRFGMPLTTDFVVLNDSTVIAGDFNNQNRLVSYTPHTKRGLFPVHSKSSEDGSNTGFIWRSFMDLNRSNNKLVLATQFGDVIEIYNLNDGSSIQKIGQGGIPRSASQHIKGYSDVKWRNNDIYALYASKEGAQRVPSGGNMIYVFDDEGEKKKIYYLDRFIDGFAIDEKRNLIIGITSEEDDPVYIFRMPSVE
jgi:hypothetical protein